MMLRLLCGRGWLVWEVLFWLAIVGLARMIGS
jgi:hypothetical protein